jgi:hypothetical protein
LGISAVSGALGRGDCVLQKRYGVCLAGLGGVASTCLIHVGSVRAALRLCGRRRLFRAARIVRRLCCYCPHALSTSPRQAVGAGTGERTYLPRHPDLRSSQAFPATHPPRGPLRRGQRQGDMLLLRSAVRISVNDAAGKEGRRWRKFGRLLRGLTDSAPGAVSRRQLANVTGGAKL